MKLATIDREIETSSGLVHQSFKIGDSSKMFALLADKIYSDKPRAVVREICCNALDAHKSIGQSKPFKVSTPTPIEPMFAVRDYGPGLSTEDVLGMYTTFFDSTKTGTNDQIGGFGLGSKSPFSYTDAFTVISIHQGIKSVFACFRGDDNIPQVTQTTTGPTNEPSGLEVRVPVRKDDYAAFKERCEIVLKWFPAGSFESFGFTATPTQRLLDQPKWLLQPAPTRTYDYKNNRYIELVSEVLMGPVAYQMDWKQIPGSVLPPSIIPIFQVGELDLPPSREALSYDPDTVRKLKARHDEIVSEVANLATTMVEKMKPMERLAFVDTLRKSGLDELFKAHQVKLGVRDQGAYASHKGYGSYFREDLERVIIQVPYREYKQMSRRYTNAGVSTKYEPRSQLEISTREAIDNVKFIWNDLENTKSPRIAERLGMIGISNYNGKIYLLSPTDDIPDLEAFQKHLPDTPDSQFGTLSEITIPDKVKVNKTKVEMRVYRYNAGSQWPHQNDETLTGGVYVPFTSSSMDDPAQAPFIQLGWHDCAVFGLTKKARDAVDLTQFTLLADYIIARAKKTLKDPDFLKAYHVSVTEKALGPVDKFLLEHLRLRPKNNCDLFGKLTKAAKDFHEASRNTQIRNIMAMEWLASEGHIKLPDHIDRYGIVEGLQRLRTDNPLFQFVIELAHRSTVLTFDGAHDSQLKELLSQ
jgi:hypothetical protein